MRRVVVTGLGPVSNVGTGAEAFGASIRAGRSGVSPISSFDASGFPHRNAGEVKDFDPGSSLERLDPDEWGRSSLFAAAAARLAVADAGLGAGELSRAAAGSVLGTTSGESQIIERLTEEEVERGWANQTARLYEQVPAARLAYAVNRELGLTGEATTLATACSAGNYALGYAYDLVRFGEADIMLAGGADSVLRWAHAGFFRLGAVAEEVSSPFDLNRSGIITAEGGAVLVLETLDGARARGARVYAEVLGYGLNCDADHMVSPNPAGIAECVRRAHANAGVKAEDVDYVCAHGTGTPANDLAEATAHREVFGQDPPPISSVKSMLGHTMGASSAFGAIASLIGMRDGFLPPTINFSDHDPALGGIDPVPNEARPAELNVVQNNGFAFGGNNAITVFGRVS
jgi:3-oxoacyl-[acyl-carrier-protein] synthase II